MTAAGGAGEKLTNEQRAGIEEAAEAISRNFSWADTAEGDEYWYGVYTNLLKLAGI